MEYIEILNPLLQGAKYEDEYHANHSVIVNFWNVLQNFDVDLKKKFLGKKTITYLFVLGCGSNSENSRFSRLRICV